MKYPALIFIFSFLVFIIAKPGKYQAESVSPPQGARDRLTATELLNGDLQQLVHNDYFMPVGDTLPAEHQLSGVILLSGAEMQTIHPDCDWKGCGQRLFPTVAFPVINHEGHLIPLQRGILMTANEQGSFWNIIISPGRVWQEAGDLGFSRASFPFTLTDNFVGQVRNGIATFIYNSSEISYVAIQITQETAPVDEFTIADFRGIISAQYSPEYFDNMDLYISNFINEFAERPPVVSWDELPLGIFTRLFFNVGIPSNEVSMGALFMDGTLYLQTSQTRTGPYPYPEEMRHGVFSVTKSLGLGLAMFYFAERYGQEIFEALITDYVPILSDHPGWQGVTFANTLSMATGTQGKDRDKDIVPFIWVRTSEDKLSAIKNLPDSSPEPGEVFNYASTNYFVLSCALNQYVKTVEGPDADYWELIRENVLKPMNIEFLPVSRTLESEGELGTPVMGWGSYPNVYEVAKIGKLLHDEGKYQGIQLLNRDMVRESLYRTNQEGYDVGMRHGHPTWYLNSFWIVEIKLWGCSLKVPSMSGHGGNRVVILPSGVIAIRFCDVNFYDPVYMTAVAEFYRRSCK